MRQQLQGIRATITGGAQGIGYSCAERFVSEGAFVLVADVSRERGAAAVAALNSIRPGAALFSECDVGKVEDLRRCPDRCVQQWGGIDVLINNAAITRVAGILELTEADFAQVMDVDLRAPVFATQHAARQMIAQETGGVIINMSSVNAVLTIPKILVYNLAKGALNQLTRNTAIALAPHGIRVCGTGRRKNLRGRRSAGTELHRADCRIGGREAQNHVGIAVCVRQRGGNQPRSHGGARRRRSGRSATLWGG
jgi:NAD(P)-dependent dehydrogenase (short-subunit alcohol dehydrogenase family)